MVKRMMKQTAVSLSLILLSIANGQAASQPRPHVALVLHLRGYGIPHEMPAYTRDEGVAFSDEPIMADLVASYSIGGPRPRTGKSVRFARSWLSLVEWDVRDSDGRVVPDVAVVPQSSPDAERRELIDDGTLLQASVAVSGLQPGAHYQIRASLRVADDSGKPEIISTHVAFLFVSRGDESSDIRAQRLLEKADRLSREPNFSFDDYRLLLQEVRAIPSYEFAAASRLAGLSIGRVPAAESLAYVRDARNILEAWQKRSRSTRVPPAIEMWWKTAAAAYASFERVYPIYASRQQELSIASEGIGEATHFVLRQKSDGRIVTIN